MEVTIYNSLPTSLENTLRPEMAERGGGCLESSPSFFWRGRHYPLPGLLQNKHRKACCGNLRSPLKSQALGLQHSSVYHSLHNHSQGLSVHGLPTNLEVQQRYFSYRAILAAIVSQNSFVLVFTGYRTIIARYVAKRGIAQMCPCKTKCQGRVSHHFGQALTSLKKYRAIWGIAAIVSQYRAIWGH